MVSSSLPVPAQPHPIVATLPAELNDLIFRHLGSDRTSLGRCTQVCRFWPECAYLYAFSKLAIKVCVGPSLGRTLKDFVAFLRDFDARFASFVSSLGIAAPDDEQDSQPALEITLLERALHHLPNVSDLKIAVHRVDIFGSTDPNIIGMSVLTHTTSIKTLDICLDQLCGIEEQWRSLIKSFIEIERLVVHTAHTGRLRKDEDLDMVRDLTLNPPQDSLKLQHLELVVRKHSAAQVYARMLCNVLRDTVIPALTYRPSPVEPETDEDPNACISTLIVQISQDLKEFSFSRGHRRRFLGTKYLQHCPQLVMFSLPDQLLETPQAYMSSIGTALLGIQVPSSLKTIRLDELHLRRFVDDSAADEVPYDGQVLHGPCRHTHGSCESECLNAIRASTFGKPN